MRVTDCVHVCECERKKERKEAGDWVGEGREREMGTIITALHKYKGQR